jgi:hypothetical protein
MKRSLSPIKASLALAALVLVSCTAGLEMTGVWADPAYPGDGFSNLMVLGIADSPTNVRIYEADLYKQLKTMGINSTTGSSIMDTSRQLDKSVIRKAIDGYGFDAVLVTRVMRVEEETVYVPGSTYVVPQSYYHGYYSYYSTAYVVAHEPGYTYENTTVLLESNLYDVKTEKLVWSAQSKAYNMDDTQRAIAELSKQVTGSLAAKGMLRGVEATK